MGPGEPAELHTVIVLSSRFPGEKGAEQCEQQVSEAEWRREETLCGVPAQLPQQQQLQPGTSPRDEGGAGQGDQSQPSLGRRTVWPGGGQEAAQRDHQQVQWTDQRGN